MYRTSAIVVFAAVAVMIAADLLRIFLSRGFSLPEQKAARGSHLLRLLRIGINMAGLACLAAVAATGFLPVFTRQPSLSGNLLMAHVTTAGGFAVAGVAVALVWVSRNRFAQADSKNAQPDTATHRGNLFGGVLLRKVSFLIALASAVPTLATALLAMFPLASPIQQQELLEVHRICALLLAAAAILFAYSALATAWQGHGK